MRKISLKRSEVEYLIIWLSNEWKMHVNLIALHRLFNLCNYELILSNELLLHWGRGRFGRT